MSKFRFSFFVAALICFILGLGFEFAGACYSMGLGAVAIFDLFVLMTVGLITAPMILTNAVVGRIQGVLTFIAAFIILVTILASLFSAISLLIKIIISLYFPLSYLFVYADFPVAVAGFFLIFSTLFKIGFVFFMVAAHQRFLENFGLVKICATSLGLTALVSLTHGLPRIFVSITDDIGAIIILVVALIRSVGFLLGSLPAVKKAIGI